MATVKIISIQADVSFEKQEVLDLKNQIDAIITKTVNNLLAKEGLILIDGENEQIESFLELIANDDISKLRNIHKAFTTTVKVRKK